MEILSVSRAKQTLCCSPLGLRERRRHVIPKSGNDRRGHPNGVPRPNAQNWRVPRRPFSSSPYALLRVFETGNPRRGTLWCVSLVLACWLNLFSLSILAAHAVAYAFLERKPSRRLAHCYVAPGTPLSSLF